MISKKIFLAFLHGGHNGRGEKKFFSNFLETTLEMCSILEYIGQIEILAEKNYLRVLDRLENSKNQRKIRGIEPQTRILIFGE